MASASFCVSQNSRTRIDLPPLISSMTRFGFPANRSSQASIHFAAESFDQTNMKNCVWENRVPEKNGAGDEIRTHDIHLGKVALYH